MKELSLGEFSSLASSNLWSRSQDIEIIDVIDRAIDCWDDENDTPDIRTIKHTIGSSTVDSCLNGVTIRYTEGFDFDNFEPDTLSVGTEGQDVVWEIFGAKVKDEDGDIVGTHELADYLDDDFSRVDYSGLVIEATVDIDEIEDTRMETITLDVDNEPNIRFEGDLIGSASSTDNDAIVGSYSGKTGRWSELSLYKTKSGKFICYQVGRTRWQGERDRRSCQVCEDIECVKSFFGHRWLAKELYEDAGIDDVVEVD